MIVSFDPGVTVGWAVYERRLDHDGSYRSGQIKHDTVWTHLDMIHASHDDDVVKMIVMESFLYRAHIPKANLTPVEVIGVVKEWARQNNVPVQLQTSSEGKFFFTDDKLKQMGLYKPGKPHANDAMRHLWYFLGFGKGKSLVDQPHYRADLYSHPDDMH